MDPTGAAREEEPGDGPARGGSLPGGDAPDGQRPADQVLGLLILRSAQAPPLERIVFAAAVTTVFAASFAVLLRRPGKAVIGYRG